MKSASRAFVLACLLFPGMYAIAQSAGAKPWQGPPQNRKAKSPPAIASEATEGEKRFHEHCGRCHNPPEDLSPREAKAVIRKMRVRAMLSAEDERLILQYIAP
jgi:mono/diheme cytochrome c family protein